MASWPTFDPNIFTGRISEAQWQQLQSANYPFLNRSLRAFPPASTFKIVTTAAAIESGVVSQYRAADLPLPSGGRGAFWGMEPCWLWPPRLYRSHGLE